MSSGSAPSPARLARKAAELVEQCNYDLACKFLTRALETSPSDPTLLDALADVYLQLGNVEAASWCQLTHAQCIADGTPTCNRNNNGCHNVHQQH